MAHTHSLDGYERRAVQSPYVIEKIGERPRDRLAAELAGEPGARGTSCRRVRGQRDEESGIDRAPGASSGARSRFTEISLHMNRLVAENPTDPRWPMATGPSQLTRRARDVRLLRREAIRAPCLAPTRGPQAPRAAPRRHLPGTLRGRLWGPAARRTILTKVRSVPGELDRRELVEEILGLMLTLSTGLKRRLSRVPDANERGFESDQQPSTGRTRPITSQSICVNSHRMDRAKKPCIDAVLIRSAIFGFALQLTTLSKCKENRAIMAGTNSLASAITLSQLFSRFTAFCRNSRGCRGPLPRFFATRRSFPCKVCQLRLSQFWGSVQVWGESQTVCREEQVPVIVHETQPDAVQPAIPSQDVLLNTFVRKEEHRGLH